MNATSFDTFRPFKSLLSVSLIRLPSGGLYSRNAQSSSSHTNQTSDLLPMRVMFLVTRFGYGKGSPRHYNTSSCIYGLGVTLLLSAFACGGVPSGPTAVPTSAQPEDMIREFAGEVILPPPAVMNLTLVIRGLSTEASIRLPQFVVRLLAQESVLSHLIKLRDEGRARVDGEEWALS